MGGRKGKTEEARWGTHLQKSGYESVMVSTCILLYVASALADFFYPRDAMLARVFAIATCPSVRLSVRPPHAGIVPSRAKAGS